MSANQVDDYGWKATVATCTHSYITPAIISTLRELRVNRVLDLGSGVGALCNELQVHAFDAVGVEYDNHGVALSKQRYPNARFYQLGVQDDPAKLLDHEEKFDAVVSTEVIEHLFSPHLLPAFARSVLRPGGHLLVTTPYHGYLKNLALAVAGKWDHHHTALWHGGHIKFFSRETLTNLINENGFEVVRFQGIGRARYLWKSMLVVARLRDAPELTPIQRN